MGRCESVVIGPVGPVWGVVVDGDVVVYVSGEGEEGVAEVGIDHGCAWGYDRDGLVVGQGVNQQLIDRWWLAVAYSSFGGQGWAEVDSFEPPAVHID